MTGLSWLRRRGPCHIETRDMANWQVVHVKGKFVAGEPEKKFREAVDTVLNSGASRVVVDLSESLLADDSVAGAASEAYHKAREKGVDMRFVVQPGRAGGYYHMAGLEMNIPTYSRLTGAIEF
jgi:anti-anti-sigma regulatory factor